MATTARQQYFADESSIQKDSREFAIADSVQQKIDSIEEGAQVNTIETIRVNGTDVEPDQDKVVDITIPDVIDSLSSTSTTDALSAKQGKVLYDKIQNIESRGRFLSNWNCATGLPVTNPEEDPYVYAAGDYYTVSNIAASGGTNYRPDGTQYVIGQASVTVETEEVNVSDFYLYDGSDWLLLVNTARQIAIDSSLSTTSTNPVENRVVTNAINGKQGVLTVGDGINIDSNNVISNTGVLSSNNTYDNLIYLSQQDYDNLATKDPDTLYCTPGAPDIYIVDDTPYGISWDGDTTHSPSMNAVYDEIEANHNIKTFYLTGTTGQTNLNTAQAAYDWYNVGKNPIISYNNSTYVLTNATSSRLTFKGEIAQQNQNSSSFTGEDVIYIDFSSDLVTSISTDLVVVAGSYLRLGQNYTTPYTPTNDGDPASKKYVDEHGAGIPVYSYHGDFTSISLDVEVGGDYRIVITGYHSGNINRTTTITVDGTVAATYQSTVIQTFTYQFVASPIGGTGSTIVIEKDSSTAFTYHDVYIEKINTQSGYLTATVN